MPQYFSKGRKKSFQRENSFVVFLLVFVVLPVAAQVENNFVRKIKPMIMMTKNCIVCGCDRM